MSSEDIRVLTAQLAADPSSLVFLPLGEALRRRSQLEAAEKIAVAGLTRYPDLADAHDLLARILGDRGDLERAFDEWDIALRLDARHAGAHQGIGFLYYVAGDLPRALEHLEAAHALRPDAEGVAAAVQRVREALAGGSGTPPPSPRGSAPEELPDAPPAPAGTAVRATPDMFEGLEGAQDGLLLLDGNGLRLGGGLTSPAGEQVGDVVAAHLAGVFRDASRAARLLGLGAWTSVAAETADANLYLCAPTDESLLLLVRDSSVPIGRLALQADRASAAARRWLEATG
ncbi:MAG TPA: tetratricopeptide repeat protein [Gemmatimonadales bacterium]|nr:tetratricopeptide repeat protein [Gemmatimonadales bacterium]